MNFLEIHDRVAAHVRTRLQNGEITERALARHLGISQPHVNNVLRGRRKLSPQIADQLLKFFHCSLLDLYQECEILANLNGRACGDVPLDIGMLKRTIGLGQEWTTLRDRRALYRSPCPVDAAPECLVLARLLPDPRMTAVQCGCDVALLDISISSRLADSPDDLFIVRRGAGTLLRWVRLGSRALYVFDEETANRPLDWEQFPVRREQRIEIVKARVAWMGKETSLRRRVE